LATRNASGFSDGQLDLVDPEPGGFVARREPQARPEIEQDGGGLPD
jgi:hypothetical protein